MFRSSAPGGSAFFLRLTGGVDGVGVNASRIVGADDSIDATEPTSILKSTASAGKAKPATAMFEDEGRGEAVATLASVRARATTIRDEATVRRIHQNYAILYLTDAALPPQNSGDPRALAAFLPPAGNCRPSMPCRRSPVLTCSKTTGLVLFVWKTTLLLSSRMPSSRIVAPPPNQSVLADR